MMRRNTKCGKKWAAALSAAVVVLFLGVIFVSVFLTPMQDTLVETVIVIVLLAAMAAGVTAALYQRLKEIEGGEEEDAGKY